MNTANMAGHPARNSSSSSIQLHRLCIQRLQ